MGDRSGTGLITNISQNVVINHMQYTDMLTLLPSIKEKDVPVLFIVPGFLSEKKSISYGPHGVNSISEIKTAPWARRFVDGALAPGAQVYILNWPSDPIREDIIKLSSIILPHIQIAYSLFHVLSLVTRKSSASKKSKIIESIIQSSGFTLGAIKEMWKRITDHADMMGDYLATQLPLYGNNIILLSHSLGSRISLKALSKIDCDKTRVKSISLAAAIRGSDIRWGDLSSYNQHDLEFFYSRKDWTLTILYRLIEFKGELPIGAIGLPKSKIWYGESYDVTGDGIIGFGHRKYEKELKYLLHESKAWSTTFYQDKREAGFLT